MSRLNVCLLGPPRVEFDGEVLAFRYRKNLALLAYLALEGSAGGGGPHTREALMALLWPELEPSRSRAVLRRNLSLLRKLLGGHWLVVDGELVDLAVPGAPSSSLGPNHATGADPPRTRQAFCVDVNEFRGLVSACETHGHAEAEVCPECLAALDEAASLYIGDFLAGFTLRDSANFDEWQFFQADGLRRELAGALERLVRGQSGREEYGKAIPYARRWLALDPLHEPAHRALMTVYAGSGQQSAALRQYQVCEKSLADELGLAPSEETRTLFERIRAGPEKGGERGRLVPPHNLPPQPIPFVGRAEELAEIAGRLADADCRLLALVGPGGSGKTRLALEAAAELVAGAGSQVFEHGIFFVSLAPLRSADRIVPAIGRAIGLSTQDVADARQQLLSYLRRKRMLLVLDNHEHLLEGLGLVTEMLGTAPGVKVMVTSRVGLNVQGEHRFHVGGLPCPPERGTAEGATDFGAVKLLLQSARRAASDFELADGDLAHVAQICRQVEGFPLGILLAMGWVGVLRLEEIAAEIGHGLDFLETDLKDVPARQRSVRAVLDHSWRLLSQREQEILAALSVFHSGFSRGAAQQVTGGSLRELKALIDRSLLERTADGRYKVHELVRQYAAEKLGRSPGVRAAVRERHSAFYAAAWERWYEDFKGPRRQAALSEIDEQLEDVSAAWEWAAQAGAVQHLNQSCEPTYFYYRWRQRHTAGEGAFRLAAAGLTAALKGASATATAEQPVLRSSDGSAAGVAADSPEALLALAKVLALRIPFSVTLGQREVALRLADRSAALQGRAEQSGQDVRRVRAWLLTQEGHIAAVSHDLKEWRRATGQALAFFRALDDRWMVAHVLGSTGFAAQSLGAHDEARELHEECLAIRRQLGDPIAVADSFERLGYLAMELGELEEGERLRREYVSILRRTGDKAEIAFGLMTLGWSLVWLGRFSEALTVSTESLQHWRDLGLEDRAGAIRTHPLLGCVRLHLGQYQSARATMRRALRLASRYAHPRPPGHPTARPMQALGAAALGEEDYLRARRQLQRCAQALEHTSFYFSRLDLGQALADLAVAERALGRTASARHHLSEALRTVGAAGGHGFSLPMTAGVFLAGALLLADRGEAERGVELGSLAYRLPHVSNSRWYEDVFGREMTAVAEALPPDVVTAAEERGRALDADAAAAELLAELEADDCS